MNLKDAVKFILEQIETDTDPANHSHDGLNCPDEAEILAYCEGRVSEQNKDKIYKHIATCQNCIELLAMFAQISEQESDDEVDLPDNGESKTPNVQEKELAEKVLDMIESDEMKYLDSI
jgi:hypothetical protein